MPVWPSSLSATTLFASASECRSIGGWIVEIPGTENGDGLKVAHETTLQRNIVPVRSSVSHERAQTHYSSVRNVRTSRFAIIRYRLNRFLAIGDALSETRYFDHAPELELIYHLRNGVAHGNRFHFTDFGKKRLADHPAHNRFTPFRTDTTKFEITTALEGQPVLFDFMGPADVLDLLGAVGVYLWRMGQGDPLRPEFEAGL